MLVCYEHGDRRTAMLATAVAVAPCHPYRFAGSDKSHCAAQTCTLGSVAHLGLPLSKNGGHSWLATMNHAAASVDKPAAGGDSRGARLSGLTRASHHGLCQ